MLDQVLEDCRRSVPGCRAWTTDLSEISALDGFVARVERELGVIDVLVNNAGLALAGDATSTAWSDVEHLVRLNYLSPVRLTLAALPAMRTRGSGHVVTVSSMAARMSTPGEAAYAAAKAALSAFFEALAAELWDSPVRFHLVYPALIDLTPGIDGNDALAADTDGSTPIPAAVVAREMRRQLERGDFELYIPHTMKGLVAHRARDVAASVEFMAELHRAGTLHGPPAER